MKITFLGANHEVTGSCTLIEAAGQRFLIDCGMEQGKDVYENQPIPVLPGEIDWVLATHAHIDHTGMLPLLVRNGFRGKIYATNPTVELCGIMLRDSAHIQEFEAEWFFCALLQENPFLDRIPFREGGSGAVLSPEFPMSHKFFTDILEKLSCLGLVFAR